MLRGKEVCASAKIKRINTLELSSLEYDSNPIVNAAIQATLNDQLNTKIGPAINALRPAYVLSNCKKCESCDPKNCKTETSFAIWNEYTLTPTALKLLLPKLPHEFVKEIKFKLSYSLTIERCTGKCK